MIGKTWCHFKDKFTYLFSSIYKLSYLLLIKDFFIHKNLIRHYDNTYIVFTIMTPLKMGDITNNYITDNLFYL